MPLTPETASDQERIEALKKALHAFLAEHDERSGVKGWGESCQCDTCDQATDALWLCGEDC